jgi:hypothetical protein
MATGTVVTLVVTVGLAITGYVATYLSNQSLARRKDRLERINRQLAELYGPLYALSQASGRAFEAFHDAYWPERRGFFVRGAQPSVEDLEVWRRWMTVAFMPLNRRMVDVIVNHSDLLVDDSEELPQCLLDLCAHVTGYEPVIARWGEPGFDSRAVEDHVAPLPFPRAELDAYVGAKFRQLRQAQGELLAVLARGVPSG